MDERTRKLVWERDTGSCQHCKKQLSFLQETDYYDELMQCLQDIKTVPVFKFTWQCWNCKQQTAVVTYDLLIDCSYAIGSLEKLDVQLMPKYPLVKKVFSHTMNREVIANTCAHCGIIQGNHFIDEHILNLKCCGNETDMHEVGLLCNNLHFEDLSVTRDELTNTREMKLPSEIHHIDRDRSNDTPQNLVLLCQACHLKLHASLRNLTKTTEES